MTGKGREVGGRKPEKTCLKGPSGHRETLGLFHVAGRKSSLVGDHGETQHERGREKAGAKAENMEQGSRLDRGEMELGFLQRMKQPP
ncbi:hypothetical protein L1049_021211 [Liquidambar formosana]|uniref:Uncharacterized protein n=1 Tax=Liquidambar formosana TaxID=63359 RepID=A0AAP0SE80_LIQFO